MLCCSVAPVEVARSLVRRQVLKKCGIFKGDLKAADEAKDASKPTRAAHQRVSTLADESNAAAASFLPH